MRILILVLVASLIGVPSAYALVSIKCETASDPRKWKRQKNLKNIYFIVAIETEGKGENKIEKGTYHINTNSGDALNLNLQQNVDKIWIENNRDTHTYTYIDRKTLDYMTLHWSPWARSYKHRPMGKCEVLETEVFNSEIENILKEKGQGNQF